MKKIILFRSLKRRFIFCLIVSFAPVLLFSQNVHKKISTLFLGNSYTYVNNLPLLIYNIALANGDTLIYDSNTPGGYTFSNHFSDAQSISKIKSKPWKFVVLQAQSQEPAFPPNQVNSQTLPFALNLDSVIKQNNMCTNTVFYETWGRKNGDAQNCNFYPPLCTYVGMQDRLKLMYKKFSDTVNGVMSPVGEAFRKSISQNPAHELYDPDESHPSLSGSYLAAAVFYEVLFQKSVLTNTYNPGINTGTLSFLQQVAHNTINDSLGLWNIGTNLPWADFNFNQTNPNTYQFQSVSSNFNDDWYFGDGNTAGISSPFHTYASPGTYTVSHVVSGICGKDSVAKAIVIITTNLEQLGQSENSVCLYPNPSKSIIFFENARHFAGKNSKLEIRNAIGQLMHSSEFKDSINIDHLQNGLYFVKIYNELSSASLRFIKGD